MKNEILQHLLGEASPAFYIAAIITALVGVTISLLISCVKRDHTNPTTPDKFSVAFLLWDNSRRILLSALLILVTLRFSVELIGATLNMWGALLIGFGWDRLSSILKNKDLLNLNKRSE